IEVLFDTDVPLARIAENGDYVFAWSKFLGHFLRSEYIGPRRNSHQETFLFRELLGRLIGLVVGHGHHTIENGLVQHFWDEPSADTLNLMGAWLSTGQDRRSGRFHCNHLHMGVPFLKYLSASGNGTACAHC